MESLRSDLIFDIDVVSEDLGKSVDIISNLLERKACFTLVFLNSNLLYFYRKSLLTLDLKDDDVLVFPDGMFLNLCNLVFNGKRFKANLNGTDVCPRILDFACPNLRIAIVGGAGDLHRLLRERFDSSGDLNLVSLYSGYFATECEKREVVEGILSDDIDIVFSAMGNPAQENFVKELRNAGFQGSAICVGAFFNFLVGIEKRAPKVIRKARMEWFYRFLQNPRRLYKRYFLLGPQLFLDVLICHIVSKLRRPD